MDRPRGLSIYIKVQLLYCFFCKDANHASLYGQPKY